MKKAYRLHVIILLVILGLTITFASNVSADGETPLGTCPRSQGYWANHPTEWAVPSLMLGTQFYTQSELLLFLPGGGGDASLQLAVQLVAVKLNLAAGAYPAPITAAMLQADAVLAQLNGKLPYNVDPSTPTGQALISLASMLNAYNNGQMTPGCVPTPTPTLTPTPGPSATPPAGASPTPIATTLPTIIVIEGPVQAINVNIITIYNINIQIDANDPILAQIHVGDFVRVEGSTITGTTSFVVVAVNIYIVNADVVITNNDEVVWQDNRNNCQNPPPPWAPANGWRRRCQGQNFAPGNNGNGHGNGNGNGHGNGNGNGNGNNK